MQNSINTVPIAQFAQLLRAAELSQQREIKMSIQDARLLGHMLIELQNKLLQDYEALLIKLKNSSETDVVQIALDGGGFKD